MFNNSTSLELCISGASISRCPWLTWVDLLKMCLHPQSVIDHSCKGAGNQFIIRSAIHALQRKSQQKFLAVMLTNFDKYDMWVRDEKCIGLQAEKHPPHWIDGSLAINKGYWCTGSHFPLIKDQYKEHFFDLENAAAQDLTALLGLIKYCEDCSVKLLIMFDSPVFDYTETQINSYCQREISLKNCGLGESLIVTPLSDCLQSYVLDSQGLIGFCLQNDLPWFNTKYGPHPPSSSHLLYFQEKIIPWIQVYHSDLALASIDTSDLELIVKMTERWTQKKF